MSSRLLVVFDLDGVIARTDTMAFLLQRQLLSHPLRAIAGAPPAVAWFVLHRFPRIRVRLSRALGRAALSGLSETEYRALATKVGARRGTDVTQGQRRIEPSWPCLAGLCRTTEYRSPYLRT